MCLVVTFHFLSLSLFLTPVINLFITLVYLSLCFPLSLGQFVRFHSISPRQSCVFCIHWSQILFCSLCSQCIIGFVFIFFFFICSLICPCLPLWLLQSASLVSEDYSVFIKAGFLFLYLPALVFFIWILSV